MAIREPDILEVQKEVKEHTDDRKVKYGSVTEENWNPVHQKTLMLTARRWSAKAIAKTLKLSENTIATYRNSPYFKERLANLTRKIEDASIPLLAQESVSRATDQARAILIAASVAAAKKMDLLSKRGKPEQRIQYEACKDILDRTGLKPREETVIHERIYSETEVKSALVTAGELENTLGRLTKQGSPFLLSGKPAESSVTEDSSDAQTKPQADATT